MLGSRHKWLKGHSSIKLPTMTNRRKVELQRNQLLLLWMLNNEVSERARDSNRMRLRTRWPK